MQYIDQLLLPTKEMKKDQACTTLSSFCRRIVFHKLSSFHCFTCCTTITDQPRAPLFLPAQVVFRLNIQEDMNASVEAQILRHLPTLLPAVLFAVGKSTPFISIAESFDSTQRSKRLKAVRRLQQAFRLGALRFEDVAFAISYMRRQSQAHSERIAKHNQQARRTRTVAQIGGVCSVVCGAFVWLYVGVSIATQRQACSAVFGPVSECMRPRVYFSTWAKDGFFSPTSCSLHSVTRIVCGRWYDELKDVTTMKETDQYQWLTNLTEIDVSDLGRGHRIVSVPKSWALLPNLQKVNVSHNAHLSSFPFDLCNAAQLELTSLDLTGTPAATELDWSGLGDAVHAALPPRANRTACAVPGGCARRSLNMDTDGNFASNHHGQTTARQQRDAAQQGTAPRPRLSKGCEQELEGRLQRLSLAFNNFSTLDVRGLVRNIGSNISWLNVSHTNIKEVDKELFEVAKKVIFNNQTFGQRINTYEHSRSSDSNGLILAGCPLSRYIQTGYKTKEIYVWSNIVLNALAHDNGSGEGIGEGTGHGTHGTTLEWLQFSAIVGGDMRPIIQLFSPVTSLKTIKIDGSAVDLSESSVGESNGFATLFPKDIEDINLSDTMNDVVNPLATTAIGKSVFRGLRKVKALSIGRWWWVAVVGGLVVVVD